MISYPVAWLKEMGGSKFSQSWILDQKVCSTPFGNSFVRICDHWCTSRFSLFRPTGINMPARNLSLVWPLILLPSKLANSVKSCCR